MDNENKKTEPTEQPEHNNQTPNNEFDDKNKIEGRKRPSTVPWVIYLLAVALVASIAIQAFNHREYTLEKDSAADANTTPEDSTLTNAFTMEQLGDNYPFYYYRDTVTDVMYIQDNSGNGFIVMQDAETGLPLTYTRYMELYEGMRDAEEEDGEGDPEDMEAPGDDNTDAPDASDPGTSENPEDDDSDTNENTEPNESGNDDNSNEENPPAAK